MENAIFVNMEMKQCVKNMFQGIEPCGFSEQIKISKWIIENNGIIKLPSTISFAEGTLIEPLSCCVRAWKDFILKNDSVAVLFDVVQLVFSMDY